MRKLSAVLIALCVLASVLPAPAEEPVVFLVDIEIVFAISECDENWEALTGEAPAEDPSVCTRYYLRLRAPGDASEESYDSFCRRLSKCHVVNYRGYTFDFQSASIVSVNSGTVELGAVFYRAAQPGDTTIIIPAQRCELRIDGRREVYSLRNVPVDDQGNRLPEPTPIPPEDPEKLARLNGLFGLTRAQIVIQEGEPEYGEKLVFAVYKDYEDEDPVLSYRSNRYTYDCIPEERLAKSLDEADTIVFIWAEYDLVGHYTNGLTAEKCRMMVGVYNLKEDCIYKSFKALSSDPPHTLRGDASNRGEYTPREVVKLIAELLAE